MASYDNKYQRTDWLSTAETYYVHEYMNFSFTFVSKASGRKDCAKGIYLNDLFRTLKKKNCKTVLSFGSQP